MTKLIYISILALLADIAVCQSIDLDVFAQANISPLSAINTEQIECAPFPMGGGIVFLKAADRREALRLMYYDRAKDSLAQLSSLMTLPSDYHHGPVCYQENTGRLYFSRNNPVASADGKYNMMLSVLDPSASDSLMDFAYNDVNYSIMHPTVNNDDDILIFASDMPGGHGGMDLYLCQRNEKQQWGKPTNLGPMVNTVGNELFPFFYDDQWLYYSSDGHNDKGGLDIYLSQLSEGAFSVGHNLGAPINSGADDTALVIQPGDSLSAYFSSNRSGGQGADDIYQLSFDNRFYKVNNDVELIDQKLFVLGVFDEKTFAPLSNVKLSAKEIDLSAFGEKPKQVIVSPKKQKIKNPATELSLSDMRGQLTFALDANKKYRLYLDRAGYRSYILELDARNNVQLVKIYLQPAE